MCTLKNCLFNGKSAVFLPSIDLENAIQNHRSSFSVDSIFQVITGESKDDLHDYQIHESPPPSISTPKETIEKKFSQLKLMTPDWWRENPDDDFV